RPGSPDLVLRGHSSEVESAEFSPDGARIVTASQDRTVRLWDARDGTELWRFEGHRGNVAQARFLAGGALVATRSAEPMPGRPVQESEFSARLLDARDGRELFAFTGHTSQVLSLDATRDARWLVTTSEDHTARLWRRAGEGFTRWELARVVEAPGKFHCAA